MKSTGQHLETSSLVQNLKNACQSIAPVWPLESFVAVNPYMGLISDGFGSVADRLRRVAGARMTMPTTFYLEALDGGRMTLADVAAALPEEQRADSAEAFVAAARMRTPERAPEATVLTVADVAASTTGIDWARLTTEYVSAWAATYFDGGQAEWRSCHRDKSLYAAWRSEAELDRTPEVIGARRFRAIVARLPAEPLAAAEKALHWLDVPHAALELYLHRLLMRVGGWSAYAGRIVWDRGLHQGEEDETLLEFLCVLLSWEFALLEGLRGSGVATAWNEATSELSVREALARSNEDLEDRLVLQNAYERAAQRKLVESINEDKAVPSTGEQRPSVQAVFCIDVRSEVYRRHLEATDGRIETLGFAGFFAFPISFVPLGHEDGGAHCPVLLTPSAEIVEGIADSDAEARAIQRRSVGQEVKRAWQAFKMGAVSCFSFVGPVGLAYLPKLFTDAFGWTRPVPHPSTYSLDASQARAKGVRLDPGHHHGRATGLSMDARVDLAAGALGAMSLSSGFARIVLLNGHGSTTVNNPHATGLDCGACGGRTGEANARVAVAVLNDPEVRARLLDRGIEIPTETIFLAGQHDTTTDEVTLFDECSVPASHADDLHQLKMTLAQASRAARAERAARLHVSGGDIDAAVLARSRNWAEVRPEWGLAGCSAFIAAPRRRTETLSLDGRSFLHSYEWRQDKGFSVLELIMTAPMVVASWISLQYYASTVDPELFGSGNKTLHNVVGTVGVFEGNGGDLRVGLPWQSVHDGERVQHDPLRLNVMIEAPKEAMNAVIEKHEMVRHLLDNGWLHLFALDVSGKVSHVYAGNLSWRVWPLEATPTQEALAS